MKIIADSHKQLNYHPLIIYFMLQPKDHELYAKALNGLNKYNGFTRGIFKFRAVERGTKYCEDLTNDLKATLKKFNVIVRLVDDEEGNYNYALGKMNFSQEPDRFELSMQKFIIDVCEQNIKNLDNQLKQYTSDSEESKEYADMIAEMTKIFRNAIMLKGFRHGVWKKLLFPEPMEFRFESCFSRLPSDISFGRQLPLDILKEKENLENELSDYKSLKLKFNELWAKVEAIMNTPSFEESDRYVQGTVDHSRSEDFSLDYKSRNKPSIRPNITITITKVVSRELKNRTKMAWGVEIEIEGDVVPVYIGSVAAAMVYICTLLKKKMGTHLYRSAFKKSLSENIPRANRDKDVIWMEQVYKTLYPGATEDFKCWYLNMQKNSCQFINQGKGAASRKIIDILVNHQNATPFCIIETCKNEPTYYNIDVPAENIIVHKDLEDLITFE